MSMNTTTPSWVKGAKIKPHLRKYDPLQILWEHAMKETRSKNKILHIRTQIETQITKKRTQNSPYTHYSLDRKEGTRSMLCSNTSKLEAYDTLKLFKEKEKKWLTCSSKRAVQVR